MTADLWAEDRNRKDLTDGTVTHMLKDHAITACPSGGYLHIASANVSGPNDSAYAYRYDDNFDLLSWSILEESVPQTGEGWRAHNDIPVACSPNFKATVFGGQDGPDGLGSNVVGYFFLLDDNASTMGTTEMTNVPQTGGNSFLVEPETGNLLIIEIQDNTDEIDVTRVDVTTNPWSVIEVKSSTVLSGGDRGGWPQAAIRVNNHYIVAFINQGNDQPGLLGDVALAVFDFDWNLLEVEQVTNSHGCMTPGLARRGNQLIVSYDKLVVPNVLEVTLDTQAFGLDDDSDTGFDWDTGESGPHIDSGTGPGPDTDQNPQTDTADGDHTGEDDGPKPYTPSRCGCLTTEHRSSPWVLPLLGLLGLGGWRQRRASCGRHEHE